MLRRRHLLIAIVALTLGACSAGTSAEPTGTATTSSGTATASMGATEVNVILQEWSVVVDPLIATAGDVTFLIKNHGPDDVHELVIIQTDLAPEALPTAEDGAVDEEGEGITVLGEVKELGVGEAEDLTVQLDAGNYALICNIVKDDVHYQMGMRAAFTVE